MHQHEHAFAQPGADTPTIQTVSVPLYRKKVFSCLLKTCLVLLLSVILIQVLPCSASVNRNPVRLVRVGAFNYYPGIFQDKDGTVKGFYVDALDEIARQENIRFEYVYGSWSEGLERLKAGKVDVLTSVAWTAERSVFMEYSKTPLLTVWGELYVPLGSKIDNIRDVAGRKIAVMKDDVNARHFMELVKKFGINCTFVEVPGFEEVFKATSARTVDAGVVNCTFGVPKHKEYGLRSTGVIFNPFDIFFSVAKGRNRDLLELLDNYLHTWRNQQDSVYNAARKKWAHGTIGTMQVIPRWLINTMTALGLASLGAVLFILLLRRRVRSATSDLLQREVCLRESEEKFRGYIDNSPEGVFVTDEQGRYLEVNRSAAVMTGYSEAELLGRCFTDLLPPESTEIAMNHFQTMKATGNSSFDIEFLHKNGTRCWGSVDAVKLSENRYLAFAKDNTESKRAGNALKAALAEKEALLREVHHRVKNNLAAIIGLLELQRTSVAEPETRAMLTELSGRIRSMSLVHEKLYNSESLSRIDCQEYLQDFVYHLRSSYDSPGIVCHVAAQGVEMPLDLAVPCGLIINELITNSLKYAFPRGKPHPGTGQCRIDVSLVRDEKTFTLSVADNGVGLPPGFEWSTTKTLGLVLVRMLGQHQLGGRYEIIQDQGTRFSLTFPIGPGRHPHD